jgi:hypothetical protein
MSSAISFTPQARRVPCSTHVPVEEPSTASTADMTLGQICPHRIAGHSSRFLQ